MTTKHIYSTTNLSDLQLKEQGNCLFAARKYDDAINCYSKAIVSIIHTYCIIAMFTVPCLCYRIQIKNPTNATYFTNPQINGKMATLHYRFLAIGRRRITAIRKL